MNSVGNFIRKRGLAAVQPSLDDEDDSILGGAADDAPYDSLARDGVEPDLERPPVQAPTSAPAADPLADYDKQAQEVQGIRADARENNLINNLGRAFSHLSQGGNKPTGNQDLYAQIDKQNAQVASDATHDLGQRAGVMKAIQMAQAKKAALDSQNARHDQDVARLEKKSGEDLGVKNRAASAYESRTKALAGNQKNRQDTANIRAAGGLFKDPNVSKETTKLNSAKSAQTLIDEIRAGHLTDSSNVKSQLTNLLTQIELGAPGGQGDRHNMGIDTLYGRLQDSLSFIEGHPNSTLPKAYLDQIETESHALGDRAASNYKSLTDAAMSGADLSMGDPDADSGQVNKLAKQRQTQFLKSAGYDPESGASTRKASGGFPRTVRNGTHQATVNSQQEADEAAKEGFR